MFLVFFKWHWFNNCEYLILGIACLTIALFISARMGIYQETLYKKHGKHPQEALFYTVSI